VSDQDPAEEGLTSPINDWNAQIIEEFRSNQGKVGGSFEGAPMLLLHTTGAKSGVERVNPMMYLEEGGRVFVFASKAGADTNPDWFRNLVANPSVSAEIGAETITASAVSLEGAERDRVFDIQKSRYPGFAEYEAMTTRVIPVVELVRA
jgi:deazaflavin-dependent oxidoreductase (nitroreductase family)